ncbi:beta-N-acetylhexosaminidase [Paraurantiacibacter namhicola]|uniref:beta-N-acetylhexosaminidase n=1 Tax=Paraurantiacibacter namhicola TaxID=645517 RepID=A0A1C7DAZ5_9SPHN|nr:beta-N-acetylhexosaminidase [Paraurantiacibacter namhicola]ANU08587.1 Beta-hexosaminidase [Paraurantiacibacter namhicola]
MLPVIFSPSGPALTEDERAFFAEADPAGYILFGRNCVDAQQLRRLTDDLRALHGRDKLLVSIDQEGGRVARLRAPNWTNYPAGEAFDRLYEIAPASAIEAARVNAHALALELSAMGITVDYHPPLDVRQEGAHDVIGDRALGRESQRVAALGRAILDGLARGGVAGCIKHMPGHGRSAVDTHKELPTVTASAEELETDIAPFAALNSAPIGMTGHLIFTEWDADNPATLSETVIRDIIRGRIGFDGLLLTDDIDMQALDGPLPERGARALAAGCDIVLNCWGKMDDMQGLAEACPAMSTQTAERLERALAGTQVDAASGDRAELLAKRDSLLAIEGAAA